MIFQTRFPLITGFQMHNELSNINTPQVPCQAIKQRRGFIFVNIYKPLRQDVSRKSLCLESGNCCMQQKRCVSSVSHVTLQFQGVPLGPKWARHAREASALLCSVGQGWN